MAGVAAYELAKHSEEIAKLANAIFLGHDYEELPGTEVARSFWALSHFAVGGLAKQVVNYRVVGQENVPMDGAAVLASNHLSKLDPLLVPCAIPKRHVVVIGREGVMELDGVLGKAQQAMFKTWGAKSIPRPAHGEPFSREAIPVIKEPLGRNQLELLFAAGHRTPGKRPGTPKRGPIKFAAEAGAKIVPIVVKGSDRVGKGEGGVTVMIGPAWEASLDRREQREQQVLLMEQWQKMFDSIPHDYEYADPDPEDEKMAKDK